MDPEAVRRRRFLLARRGYDPEEVTAFLAEVADHLEAVGEATAVSHGTESLEVEADDAAADATAVHAPAARRLLEDARATAATERLRAQRDIAALERAWQRRRDDLAAQVAELATERDRLVTDLERALEHVARLQDWLQRRGDTDRPATEHRPATTADGERRGPVTGDDAGPVEGHERPGPAVDAEPRPAAPHEGPDEAPGVVPSEFAPIEEPAAAHGKQIGAPSAEPAAARSSALRIVMISAGQDHPPDPTDAASALRRHRDEALQSVADELAAALDPALRQLAARVLEHVDEPTAAVADLLPAPGRFEALDRAGDDAIVAAFRRGWGQASTTTADEDARERALGDVGLPRLGVGDDLVTALLATLEAGRTAGEDGPGLAERVREVVRDLRRTRLPAEVPDALREAFHLGLVARHRHDHVPGIAWAVGPERRCPGNRCRANAQDGPVVPGRPFAFGEVVPPAHPGCTCVVAPAPAGTAGDVAGP